MRVLIRTDASFTIGTGHVMRCLTLAEFLRLKGAVVSFVTRPMPGSLEQLIEARGFDVCLLTPLSPSSPVHKSEDNYAAWLGVPQEDDARESIAVLNESREKFDCLVVDHYGLGRVWEEMVRPATGSVFVIDDLADRQHACDVLLDANFTHRAEARYANKVPEECRMLLGPAYSLLRSEFREHRKMLRRASARVRRILLFFGGIDRPNMTQRALEGVVMAVSPETEIEVIVGGGNPHADGLSAVCDKHSNVVFLRQVDDMASRMASADLAIGAGGTTTWERCALGLPSIIIAIAENQEPIGREAQRHGVARYLGDAGEVTAESIAEAVREVMDSPQILSDMSRAALALVDGRGVERVATCLASRRSERVPV